jgi:hypothetical protein
LSLYGWLPDLHQTSFFLFGIVVLPVLLHLAMRRVSPARQILCSALVLALSYAWIVNPIVLALTTAGYCITLHAWPPLVGQPIEIPTWIEASLNTIVLAALPLFMISLLRLWRQKRNRTETALGVR